MQRDIIIACFAVYYFIRMQKLEDELFHQCDTKSRVIVMEKKNNEMLEKFEDESQTSQITQSKSNIC